MRKPLMLILLSFSALVACNADREKIGNAIKKILLTNKLVNSKIDTFNILGLEKISEKEMIDPAIASFKQVIEKDINAKRKDSMALLKAIQDTIQDIVTFPNNEVVKDADRGTVKSVQTLYNYDSSDLAIKKRFLDSLLIAYKVMDSVQKNCFRVNVHYSITTPAGSQSHTICMYLNKDYSFESMEDL